MAAHPLQWSPFAPKGRSSEMMLWSTAALLVSIVVAGLPQAAASERSHPRSPPTQEPTQEGVSPLPACNSSAPSDPIVGQCPLVTPSNDRDGQVPESEALQESPGDFSQSQPDLQLAGFAALSVGGGKSQSDAPASPDAMAMPLRRARPFYASKEAFAPVRRGSLIEGKYLLLEQLHWPVLPASPRDAVEALSVEGEGNEDSRGANVQLKVQRELPALPDISSSSYPFIDDQQKTFAESESLRVSWWNGDLFAPADLPISPLLPSPAEHAESRTALAKAIVSVYSELVLSRKPMEKAEGFCIDPFMVMRLADAAGGVLQVWRAMSVGSEAPFVETVLKRMRCETFEAQGALEGQQQQAERLRRGLAREVFFGLWLRGAPHVSRFVELLPALPVSSSPPEGSVQNEVLAAEAAEDSEFDAEVAAAAEAASKFLPELTREELILAAKSFQLPCGGSWLVFANEGLSLTHLFFRADPGGSGLLEPNALWWHLKASSSLLVPLRVRGIAATAATAADASFYPLLAQLRDSQTDLLLFIRSLLKQLLTALQVAHERGITHRDVKLIFLASLPAVPKPVSLSPANRSLPVSASRKMQGFVVFAPFSGCLLLQENVLLHPFLPISVRLADWGSAVSHDPSSSLASALRVLWGGEAPSLLEETEGYQPPEVWAEEAAQAEQQQHFKEQQGYSCSNCSSSSEDDGSNNNGNGRGVGSLHRLPSYDIWGVGLVFLKLAIGSPTPLEPIDARQSAKLARASQGKPPEVLRRDLLVLALGDLCLVPWASDRLPAAAAPTAVAPAPPAPFISTLKNALLSAAESLYYRWTDVLRAIAFAGYKEAQVKEQGKIHPRGSSAVLAMKKDHWRDSEVDGEGLFTLLSRVRSSDGGGELILRQQQALQGPTHYGQTKRLFGDPDDSDDFRNQGTQSHSHQDCSDALFAELLRARDPAGLGVPNPLARDLLRKLLAYDPQERLSAEAALQHPWFSVSDTAAGALDEQRTKRL
ncbi:kinase-like related protein [Cyclospora cayetanensis]|uniref:Kinase-like related protein n=1 Tax=Cyclospora cayetanensis TaxID=88456 RepID=A0A1D3CT74_9EIME|nr:kinase-like related protein [Cyclospora cayetanensis]